VIGIGTDIVEVGRIEAVLGRRGERFARRILTPGELERARAQAALAPFLAKRFAAKEAIAKALGTGIGEALSWQDLIVVRETGGAPGVELSARGTQLLHARGGRRILLSLADERAYAVAFAVVLA